MIITACTTCGGSLELDGQPGEPPACDHHDGCPPPRKPLADQLFDQFAQLVEKMAAPGYEPNKHDELNLEALQNRIDALDQAPPRLGEAAVVYAEWGWPVFPLLPEQKRPATRHGFKDATTDLDRIRAYWKQNPMANIGIPTGRAFDVIDVDLPDGPESLARMKNLPDIHGQVRTASGGRHLLVEPTGRPNGARIFPGIDYRGAGGYVVAPPSWLGSTAQQWKWITKPSPEVRHGE